MHAVNTRVSNIRPHGCPRDLFHEACRPHDAWTTSCTAVHACCSQLSAQENCACSTLSKAAASAMDSADPQVCERFSTGSCQSLTGVAQLPQDSHQIHRSPFPTCETGCWCSSVSRAASCRCGSAPTGEQATYPGELLPLPPMLPFPLSQPMCIHLGTGCRQLQRQSHHHFGPRSRSGRNRPGAALL